MQKGSIVKKGEIQLTNSEQNGISAPKVCIFACIVNSGAAYLCSSDVQPNLSGLNAMIHSQNSQKSRFIMKTYRRHFSF